ncbi:hypothetical protein ACJMK2_033114 [Sinanodonta woodiana]|uniref:Uncharacterized protein n=1 Tax=Sinanodonta woodiana TaxID=1069815 RepID=A0ABD3X410_SINWO
MAMLCRETGMSRRVLKSANSKGLTAVSRRRRVLERERIKKRVISFMERDDVSVNMPGKNDCTKVETGERKQTRVLTDYLSNLFEKFCAENRYMKVSKSVFCRLRPTHILLTKLKTRNTCLCSRHQNFAMKLIDSFFLVKLDDVIYPAKVLQVNDRKHEAKVSFMEEARQRGDTKLFKWPERDDIQKVDYEQFVREIQEPSPCSKRQFQLQEIDYMFFDTES